jgi:hypothetical protein
MLAQGCPMSPFRLLLLSSIALAAGCGDAVRTWNYVGETPFRIRYRFPAPLETLLPEGANVMLWLKRFDGGALHLRISDLRDFEQEGVAEVPANVRRQLPLELSSNHGGPIVYLLHATFEPNSPLPDRRDPLPGMAPLHHWLAYREAYPVIPPGAPRETGEEVAPVGIRPWPTDLLPGYSLVRRSCSAESFVRFERVPGETVVDLLAVEASDPDRLFDLNHDAYDATFFAECGLPPPAPLPGVRISEDPASELAFAPDSDTLFALHLPAERQPLSFAPTVRSWSPGGPLSPLASGVFRGRIQVAAGNTLTVDGFENRDPILFQLSPGPSPGPWILRPLRVPPDALLSPQGDRVAFEAGESGVEQIAIHEIASGTTRQLGPGVPLAWSPDGTRVLIRARVPDQPLLVRPLDGSPPSPLPWRRWPGISEPPGATSTDTTLYLFGAGGPLLLQRRGELVQSQGEPPDFPGRLRPTLATLDLAASSERVVLDGKRGPVAGQFTMSPDRRSLLAWTVTCPGLGNAYCAAELHRIALEDGSDRIVLRTRRPGPAALARDGRTLAVSGAEGVFVTTLP